MKGYVHIGFIIVIAVVVVLLLLFALSAGPWHVATPKVVGTPLSLMLFGPTNLLQALIPNDVNFTG